MLISEFAISNTNNRNYKKFVDLGYVFKIGDKIEVLVSHLCQNSSSIVSAKCDICGLVKESKYSMYVKNIKKYNIYTCSGSCSKVKFKKTCLEKYGSESPMQNLEIKNRVKDYFISKYGVIHPSMLEEFELKKQNTNLEKYGVRHQMFLDENIGKIKSTKLEKYGDENYTNPDKCKKTKLERYGDENYNNYEKSKETLLKKYCDVNYNNHEKQVSTCLSRYGVENVFESEIFKDNIKSDNLEKYGVEYYQSTEEYRDKYKNTCLEKYGTESPMQNVIIHQKQQKSAFKIDYYNGFSYRGSYELDFIKFCENNNLTISKPEKIIYNLNNKQHYYFPDFYIEKYNLLCEIKSDYYYKLDESKNISKREYSVNSGYNFLFIINKDYSELEKIINR